MTPEFLRELHARSARIQERWRELLHVEPVSTPLANPEYLQLLIPEMWEKILQSAGRAVSRPISLQAIRSRLPACNCGNNPYRAFFTAGEQAVTEAAVLIQCEQPAQVRNRGDLIELKYILLTMARLEIDTFCRACVHRGTATHCRFDTPLPAAASADSTAELHRHET